jgi:hypothetical protein
MASRRTLFLGLVLGAAALLLLAGPALAAEPDGPTFEIILQVGADGSWAIPSFGGVDLGLTSSNFAALSKTLNLGLQVPTIDAPTLKIFSDQGVQSLALIKEGQKINVLVNNQPLSAVTLGDEAVAAVGSFIPDLEDMLASVSQANVSIGVQLASTAGEVPALDITQRLAAGAAGEAVNAINLGTTISPEGHVLSVGGLGLDELGLQPIQFDASLLERFGLNQVQASLTGSGVTVAGNGAEWLRLDWNMDLLKAQAYTSIPSITGMAISDENRRLVEVGSDWLSQTNIQVLAQVAAEPQEALPTLQLGRPILVELKNDNSIAVEGIPLAVNVGAQIGAYRNQVQTVSLKWDGARARLYPVVNDKKMPYLTLEKELVSTIGTTFVNKDFAWGDVADILGNVGLTVAVMGEGGPAPDLSLAEYDATPAKRAPGTVPAVTICRADGGIAVNNATVPLTLLKNLFGVSVADVVTQQVQVLTGVNSAELLVAPGGLTAGVNGSEATLVWDKELRDNLVTLAMGVLLQDKEIDLTTVKESGVAAVFPALRNLPRTLEVGMARTLLDALTNFELGVNVTLQDEQLPAAYLDSFAALVPAVSN